MDERLVEFTIHRIGGADAEEGRRIERQFGPYVFPVNFSADTLIRVPARNVSYEYIGVRLCNIAPCLHANWVGGRLSLSDMNGSPHGFPLPFMLYALPNDIPTHTLCASISWGAEYGVYSVAMRCVARNSFK